MRFILFGFAAGFISIVCAFGFIRLLEATAEEQEEVELMTELNELCREQAEK